MKVLFHFDAPPALLERTRAACGPDIELIACSETDEARFLALLPTVEVVWHVLRPLTAAHFEQATRLRLVQKLGIGLNTIALDAAGAHGVAVCNTPGANSRAVAEMALLLMLGTLRRLPELQAVCQAPGGGGPPGALQERLAELGGRTVGLVGFGAVAQLLAAFLTAMGAQVIYSEIAPRPDSPFAHVPLDELLGRSDIVSLHVPLTPDTARLIDARRIGLMKRGAILINTARGGLVDEAALRRALEQGHIGAAGLDVFADEPVAPDHPLLKLPNVIGLPHVAWLTAETLDRCLAMAIENCRRLGRGEILLHRAV